MKTTKDYGSSGNKTTELYYKVKYIEAKIGLLEQASDKKIAKELNVELTKLMNKYPIFKGFLKRLDEQTEDIEEKDTRSEETLALTAKGSRILKLLEDDKRISNAKIASLTSQVKVLIGDQKEFIKEVDIKAEQAKTLFKFKAYLEKAIQDEKTGKLLINMFSKELNLSKDIKEKTKHGVKYDRDLEELSKYQMLVSTKFNQLNKYEEDIPKEVDIALEILNNLDVFLNEKGDNFSNDTFKEEGPLIEKLNEQQKELKDDPIAFPDGEDNG